MDISRDDRYMRGKMKILLVSPLPPPVGGIATWTEKYKKYCDENNIDLSIVNIALNGERAKRINSNRNFKDEISRTFSVLSDFKKQIKFFSPDIVHINSACSNFGVFRDCLCTLVAYRRHIPVVLHCHCNIQSQIHNKLSVRVLKYMMDKADYVILLNKKSLQYAEKLTTTDMKIVPNFIEEEMISSSFTVREEIKEVIFVGHVQPAKGCREIIEAAEKLPQIHFSLVGPISSEIAAMNCCDNVSLVGAKVSHDIKGYLEQADVYLLPSYTEGFSISLTEAMAVGMPTIVTDVGANSDMVEKNGGIVIPVKSSEAIVTALKQISGKEIRKSMSTWNINKVKNNYLLNIVMEHLVNIYKEVLK